MWICPKCGREFKRTNQSHYCGKTPKTVLEYINSQPIETQTRLTEMMIILQNSVPGVNERILWSMPYYEKEGKSISFSACKNHSITGTFIYLRMSRKKFIRNLIKQGYSKKNAKWIAWYCCKKRIPYSKANTLIYFGLSIVWGDYGCYLTAW